VTSSVSKKLEIFQQQSVRSAGGLCAATSANNYQLAALNCRQGVKCRLMLGLIQWRSGDDPTASLTECVRFHKEAIQSMKSIDNVTFTLLDTSVERVGFVAYLVGAEWSVFDTTGFAADRMLDAILSNSLFGAFDPDGWDSGMSELREKGSPLAVASYENYKAAVRAHSEAVTVSVSTAEECFKRRQSDPFFCNADQSEGGGTDNEFVVDYRFAALAKHIGLNSLSAHAWRW